MDLDKDELEVTKNKNRIIRLSSYLKQMREIEVLDMKGTATAIQLLYYCICELKEYLEDEENK